MEKNYNHKEVEPRVSRLWEKSDYFTPKIDPAKKAFSIFPVRPLFAERPMPDFSCG